MGGSPIEKPIGRCRWLLARVEVPTPATLICPVRFQRLFGPAADELGPFADEDSMKRPLRWIVLLLAVACHGGAGLIGYSCLSFIPLFFFPEEFDKDEVAYAADAKIDGFDFEVKLFRNHPMLAEYRKVVKVKQGDKLLLEREFIDPGGLASFYVLRKTIESSCSMAFATASSLMRKPAIFPRWMLICFLRNSGSKSLAASCSSTSRRGLTNGSQKTIFRQKQSNDGL